MFRKALTFAIWLILVFPAVSLAAATQPGDGEKIGANLGHLIGSWAKSIYAGVAAIVACIFLFNRKFTELLLFVGAAIVVGGFVLAPDSIAATVRDIWHSLTA